MKIAQLLFVSTVSLLAACASEESRETEPESIFDLSAFENEEGRSCLPLTQIRSTRILGDRVIEFTLGVNQHYVNILPRRCPGLRPGRILGWRTSQSQLCHLDIIRVLDTVGGGLQTVSACGLGYFHSMPEAGIHGDIEDDDE